MVRLLLGQVIDGPLIVYVAFSLKNGEGLRLCDCSFEFRLGFFPRSLISGFVIDGILILMELVVFKIYLRHQIFIRSKYEVLSSIALILS